MKTRLCSRPTLLGAALPVLAALAPNPAAACGADPYLGEICLMATDFCPRYTVEAAGQILPIQTNQALFSLYGTTYGGDGVTTFALPDLTRDSGLFIRSTSTERTVGSVQGDAIRNIKGAFGFLGTGKSQGWATNLEGAFGYIQDTTNRNTVSMSSTGTLNNTTKQWTFDASKSVPTAEENRPVNIAFMPVIKY